MALDFVKDGSVALQLDGSASLGAWQWVVEVGGFV